jgi:hypothetical protein
MEELLPQGEGAGDVIGHAERGENDQQEIQTSVGLPLHALFNPRSDVPFQFR